MNTNPWNESGAQSLATLRPAVGVDGYLQHAARSERMVGLVLWLGLAAVLLLTSM